MIPLHMSCLIGQLADICLFALFETALETAEIFIVKSELYGSQFISVSVFTDGEDFSRTNF